jgi:hypothetical protein
MCWFQSHVISYTYRGQSMLLRSRRKPEKRLIKMGGCIRVTRAVVITEACSG